MIALYANLPRNPTHVPDLWETRTPLAGTIPRHEKLWLLEGSAPVNPQRKSSPVYVPLPGPVTLDLTAGSHPIEFGAVVRPGAGALDPPGLPPPAGWRCPPTAWRAWRSG